MTFRWHSDVGVHPEDVPQSQSFVHQTRLLPETPSRCDEEQVMEVKEAGGVTLVHTFAFTVEIPDIPLGVFLLQISRWMMFDSFHECDRFCVGMKRELHCLLLLPVQTSTSFRKTRFGQERENPLHPPGWGQASNLPQISVWCGLSGEDKWSTLLFHLCPLGVPLFPQQFGFRACPHWMMETCTHWFSEY